MNTDIRMEKQKIKRSYLIYPELSFKIIGILFDVHNQLGYGFAEKVYQKAVAVALKNAKLKFQEQVYAPVSFQGENISKGYLDFLIEDTLVLELKKGDRFSKTHIDQVYQYLISKKLQLGIIAYFTAKKVLFKRIVNLNS
jgi:GxxExxY protein